MGIFSYAHDFLYADICGQQGIPFVGPNFLIERKFVYIHMGNCFQGMYACIGAALTRDGYFLAEQRKQGFFQRGLDGNAVGLILPTAVSGSEIR